MKYAQGQQCQRRSRGAIALWMLTKFAMLFFLAALTLVIANFAFREKGALCVSEASRMNYEIASRIKQVLDSPARDERRVLPLEPSLKLASGGTRYNIKLTKLKTRNSLIIDLAEGSPNATSSQCKSSSSLPLGNATLNTYGWKLGPEGNYTLLYPSNPNFTVKDRYLVILKCSTKTYPPQTHLFLFPCPQTNPDLCPQFNHTRVRETCG